MPIMFTLDLGFRGLYMSDDPRSHIDIEFYASPDGLSQPVQWAGVATELQPPLTSLENDTVYHVEGKADVKMTCDATFLCAKYAMRNDLHPPFRDEDNDNDFVCFDMKSIATCEEGRCPAGGSSHPEGVAYMHHEQPLFLLIRKVGLVFVIIVCIHQKLLIKINDQ